MVSCVQCGTPMAGSDSTKCRECQLYDWQICEDAQGEYYVHTPSGKTFDQPPQQLVQLMHLNFGTPMACGSYSTTDPKSGRQAVDAVSTSVKCGTPKPKTEVKFGGGNFSTTDPESGKMIAGAVGAGILVLVGAAAALSGVHVGRNEKERKDGQRR